MSSRVVSLKEISEKIFHLNFPTLHLMCSTMIRFQEHYECPKYKGKIFSLEEYMDWYAGQFGNFTYFMDVVGFNLPSHILDKFYQGKFNPLTKKEEIILKALRPVGGDYYLIATSSMSAEHEDDLIHEIAHGLFCVNKEYNKEVKKILKGQNLKHIYAWLKLKGYHKSHFLDEAHAILIERASTFKRCGEKADDYRKIRKSLKDNYNRHFKQLSGKPQRIKL